MGRGANNERRVRVPPSNLLEKRRRAECCSKSKKANYMELSCAMSVRAECMAPGE